MTDSGPPKDKKPSGKIKSFLIFMAVAAIFVGPRVFREQGVLSAATLSSVDAVKEKIGNAAFDNFMKGILPPGYAAMCIKQHGENPALLQAAQAFNARNQTSMTAMLQSLEVNGGLTADEKEALDKFAYSKVSGDIRNGLVSCESLDDRINSGEWDF